MAKTKKAAKKAAKKVSKKPAKKAASKKAASKAASKAAPKKSKAAPKKPASKAASTKAASRAAPKQADAKAPKATAAPAEPKTPKAPKAKAEAPTDIAARLGRKSGEVMVFEGENAAPDDVTLQDWAYDWFLNAGGFDAIKGSDDNDPTQQAAIKQSFFDAFKTAVRTRLNLAQPNALG